MDIESFMLHLSGRTQSKHTLTAYRSDLEKFEEFLRSKCLRVTQVTPQTLDEFIEYLSAKATRKAGDRLSPASISRRLAVVAAYYDYLHARTKGKISNPLAGMKRPRVNNVEFRAVEDQVVEQLLAGIPDPRDKAIIALLVASGLRLSELHQLNINSIQQRTRALPDGTKRTLGFGEVVGKGGKKRAFLVDQSAIDAVVNYLRTRGNDGIEALFISERKQRLSRRSIQDILHRYCKRLGLSRLHVHQLRHTFATRCANAGMPAVVLQELLGHSSFTVTQRYFKIRPERLAREYFSAMEFISDRRHVC